MTKASPGIKKWPAVPMLRKSLKKRVVIGKCAAREMKKSSLKISSLPSKELVRKYMAIMSEEALDDDLYITFHNAHHCVRSVVYNVSEQVVSDTFRDDLIGKTLDAYNAKYLDRDKAA